MQHLLHIAECRAEWRQNLLHIAEEGIGKEQHRPHVAEHGAEWHQNLLHTQKYINMQ